MDFLSSFLPEVKPSDFGIEERPTVRKEPARVPAMPPVGAAATAASPWLGIAQTALGLLKNDGGAAAAEAQQPGLIAAQRFGVFGDAHSAFLASNSRDVFQNQNPFFLSTTQLDNVFGDSAVEGFFNTISPGGRTPEIPWGWVFVVVVILLLLRKR